MYEAIIITKILMHFCSLKGKNSSMFYHLPSPIYDRGWFVL